MDPPIVSSLDCDPANSALSGVVHLISDDIESKGLQYTPGGFVAELCLQYVIDASSITNAFGDLDEVQPRKKSVEFDAFLFQ